MSGIIGGAGSKSRVIGLPDIDPNRPAFCARGYPSGAEAIYLLYGHNLSGSTNSVDYNAGNHYTASTGSFIAPVTGLYSFSISDLTNSTNDVYRFDFYVNNSYINRQMRIDTNDSGSGYGFGEQTIQWQLEVGEYMKIYHREGVTPANEPSYDSFSGYLIG